MKSAWGELHRRVGVAVVTVVAAAGPLSFVLAVSTGTSAAASTAHAGGTSVELAQSDLGKILVDRSGFTLYTFTRDRRDHDSCVKVSGCLAVWPAVTTKRKPTAGPGIRSARLGSIELHGDVRQITYAGHPLYTYAFDFAPRSTLYVGAQEYGGDWFAIDAAGKPVK